MEKLLSFLAKLLEAEFVSRLYIPNKLHQMKEKLADLYTAFHELKENRNCEDSLSVCSDCGQALLNDDVLEYATLISEPERCSVCNSPENMGGVAAAVEEDEGVDEGRRTCVGLEKFFGVFSFGVLVGTIVALKLLSPADEFTRIMMEASLLPPPT